MNRPSPLLSHCPKPPHRDSGTVRKSNGITTRQLVGHRRDSTAKSKEIAVLWVGRLGRQRVGHIHSLRYFTVPLSHSLGLGQWDSAARQQNIPIPPAAPVAAPEPGYATWSYTVKIFDRLRPAKMATAAELRAKLAEAEAQAGTLAAGLRAIEARRGATLLDGTPAEVKAAEAALAAARDEFAAVEAMRAALAERAAAAETVEALASFRADAATARAEAEALAAWCRDRLPALAAEMRAVVDRESAVCETIVTLSHRQRELTARHPEAAAIRLPEEPLTSAGGMGRLGEILRLPALRGANVAAE